MREEQSTTVRRLAFSREQEQQLRNVLADDRYKVINKPEIRVIYYLGMFTGQWLKDCVLLQALEERLDANSKPFPCDQLAPVLLPGGSVK